jgi:hypothetical protein
VFAAPKADSLANPTSATTFKKSGSSTVAAIAYFPVLGTGATNAKFRFRASGRASTVGSHNVTPKVSYGTSGTAGSNTIIAAATARAVATTTAPWSIWGELFWDSTSGILRGVYAALNGSTAVLDALAVLTSTVSSVDLTASGNGLTVEITIATGGGDTGYLDELTLEQV